MRRLHWMTLIAAAGLSALSASAAEITIEPGQDAAEKLTEALIMAQPGDVVKLGARRFDLTEGLSLDVDNVTVRGAGAAQTILSFKGQRFRLCCKYSAWSRGIGVSSKT